MARDAWVYDVDLSDAVWRRTSSTPADGGGIEIAFHEGIVAIRNPAQPGLPPHRFTPREWDAFVKGARAGEFALPVA